MSVILVIQARMRSSRFPQKVVAPLGSARVPLIEFLIRRVQSSIRVSEIIVATGNAIDNSKLIDIAKNGYTQRVL